MISYHIANSKDIGTRLDHFIVSNLNSYSRSRIQSWIKAGFILVNGEKCKTGYHLDLNDKIKINIPQDTHKPIKLKPENLELDIIFEDEYLIAINKSAEMVVHPGVKIANGTLVNGLIYHFENLSDINGKTRPGIVHRLDKGTSGIILVAKTNKVHAELANQFQKRKIIKEYIGMTWGLWKNKKGKINKPIARDKKDPRKFRVNSHGKSSVTYYEVKKEFNHCSLISFFPKTGRTHQIRVHSSYYGNPIFGDNKYGGGKVKTKGFLNEFTSFYYKQINCFPRHALHAYSLEFRHPKSKDIINLKAPMAPEFLNLIESFDLFSNV